jgi:cytoskeletal protein RodZ
MSLINDALKKAQKLQTQQSTAPAIPPAPPPPSAAEPALVARRSNPVKFETILLGMVALVVVLVGVTVIAVLVFRREAKPVIASASHATAPASIPPVAARAPATEPAAKPATTAPAPATAPTTPPVSPPSAAAPLPQPPPASEPPVPVAASPSPAPEVAAPVVPPTVEPPAPAVSVQIPAAPAKTAPAVAEPPPVEVVRSEPPAAVPAAKSSPPAASHQDHKILALINSLHVTGVRVAGDDSKVLMNNRVYRVNDVIDYELGVKLTGVSTTALTFVDDNGIVYTRSL